MQPLFWLHVFMQQFAICNEFTFGAVKPGISIVVSVPQHTEPVQPTALILPEKAELPLRLYNYTVFLLKFAPSFWRR